MVGRRSFPFWDRLCSCLQGVYLMDLSPVSCDSLWYHFGTHQVPIKFCSSEGCVDALLRDFFGRGFHHGDISPSFISLKYRGVPVLKPTCWVPRSCFYRGTEGSSEKRRASPHRLPWSGSKKGNPQWWTARHWKSYLIFRQLVYAGWTFQPTQGWGGENNKYLKPPLRQNMWKKSGVLVFHLGVFPVLSEL